jgi:Zn-dependent protease
MDMNALMQLIAVAIIPLIFAITLHEAAHGFVASKLGDTTALMLGRVTLNPAKHIDPIGTVLLPLTTLAFSGLLFGWAKPVPINYHHLRSPRRDMICVALAGPAANLLMALGFAFLAKVVLVFLPHPATGLLLLVGRFLLSMAQFGIMINCILLVLNLLPLPPLDGSRVLRALLPASWQYYLDYIEPLGVWILLALLLLGILGPVLWPPILGLQQVIRDLFHL